jgi:hypothetical protein
LRYAVEAVPSPAVSSGTCLSKSFILIEVILKGKTGGKILEEYENGPTQTIGDQIVIYSGED